MNKARRKTSIAAPTAVAVPIENPADGGIYHLVPMLGQEVNKLARKIVRISYLTDSRGRTIFNPDGKAVPQFDKDDDVLIDAAARYCPRISSVVEVLPDGSSRPWVDDAATPDDLQRSGLATVADIPAGHVISETTRKAIFGEFMELEVDVENPPQQPLPEFEGEPTSESQRQYREQELARVRAINEKAKKRKVGMLVAEWVIDEAAKLGQARRQEEQKNS